MDYRLRVYLGSMIVLLAAAVGSLAWFAGMIGGQF